MNQIQLLLDEGELEKARVEALDHLKVDEENAEVNYLCAVSHDAQGMEREAIPFYEKAIDHGIQGDRRTQAYIQLGSSLRCTGKYHEAREVLEKGAREFSGNPAIKVFHAMTLYNLEQSPEAVKQLLTVLGSHADSPWMKKYRKAISFYAGRLDQTW
ncbi:tetratricopeptide repeat protein [Halobacillus sp. Nhm2S1]|uniref:tetratricopeptide repeat protein n=1 Tax=Halobacillus sp. Nhm2S1 TaxID=2866716 RepID=UPI001C72EC24|nr:tetratricopeptide repeat protein [Halobacillus sp. Nhm2S1]MBX0356928.1 tetratricopeptide repeat protein [Halobacillus sp. Nhm2S1]